METFVEKFQQDGFVVIEDFVTEEDISLMKKECAEIVSAMSPNEHRTIFSTKDNHQPNIREEYFINSGDKIRFFFEEGAMNSEGEVIVDKHLALNKIGHALHVFTPSFRKLTHNEKVKSLFKCLKFDDPIVMQSMYIFKQPYIGGKVTPHQDATYLFTEPLKVLGLWIALDEASAENGCLAFIPGSHRGGLYGGYRLVRKISDDKIQCVYEGEKPAYDAEKFVQVPVKKGSLVLIDGLVVHQSEQNTSSQPRHAYTFHVFDGAISKWNERNWLQPTSTETFTHLYDTVV